jgi:hypothetical protein
LSCEKKRITPKDEACQQPGGMGYGLVVFVSIDVMEFYFPSTTGKRFLRI